MDRKTIGMIEDNVVVRNSVTKFISFHEEFEHGVIAGSVESYLHELNLNPQKKCDVLLLDIGLPGMSGIEAIPMILEATPDLEIIMLTTYEEEDIILKAICAGATSYLSKKSSLEEIIEAIRIVIKGGSYMSPRIAREIVKHLIGGRVSKATILTARQKEVLEEMMNGSSYSEIARKLFISIETVRTHVKKMYKTLQVNSKSEAIAMYLRGEIR